VRKPRQKRLPDVRSDADCRRLIATLEKPVYRGCFTLIYAYGLRITASPAPEGVLDEKGLLQRLMGDRDLGRALVAGFLEDFPQQMLALKECVSAKDLTVILRRAHGLKGAAATLGANLLRDAALAMEQAGKAGDLNQASQMLPRLDGEFERLKAVLGCSGWI
jgi:HPt (histidine-containing phosphotransfer) domain-containing protein